MPGGNKNEVLERLADSLGCSSEVFSGQAPSDLSDTLELITLWMATKDRQLRMRALAVLRNGSNNFAPSEPIALPTAAEEPK